nr:DNA-binding protein [uncultured Anaerotignum sp.]
MIQKNKTKETITPVLMPASLMSQISGIGENTLRKLMDSGEIEYLPVGNRRLLCLEAIYDYYQRHKTPVKVTILPLADLND